MKHFITRSLAAMLLVTSMAATPAFAQPGRDHHQPPPGHEFQPPPSNMQWNRGNGPPPGWNSRQWQTRQQYLRRHGHDENDNNSTTGLIAGVILGFVLGAAVADTQDRQSYAQSHLNDQTWLNSCRRRYRSFDRYNGTFLGNDGLRHYCH